MKNVIKTVPLMFLMGCHQGLTAGGESFSVNDRQRIKLEKAAAEGDGEAAFALYKHYGIYMRDFDAANFWLRKAKKLGSKEAQTSGYIRL